MAHSSSTGSDSRCYLCGGAEYKEVLRKEAVYVYADTDDYQGVRRKFPCLLNQCRLCGHVYEPVGPPLRQLLHEIYQSADAQGPTPIGVGQWGMQRAEHLFFDAFDLGTRKSAVEIGCGDGYLLRTLRERGFEYLVGIEPSVNIGRREAGITFINDFVDSRLRLKTPVDLAYSIAVFEHIEDINGILSFCRNNLCDDGELFFVVPNAEAQLEAGDPALFIHQHVHYYTTASLTRLLRQNDFEPKSIRRSADSLFVTAMKGSHAPKQSHEIRFYDDYQPKLERIVGGLRARLANSRVIMHGACNSLNNLTGWIEGDFALADNDRSKHGRIFFGHKVQSPAALDLSAYDSVVVVPIAYYEQIKKDYVARGFRGSIVRLDEIHSVGARA